MRKLLLDKLFISQHFTSLDKRSGNHKIYTSCLDIHPTKSKVVSEQQINKKYK